MIVLCGPTGVGKTHLAVELARRLNTGIVHADSRQVYRGMDIGTAKPDQEELEAVPHHMLDVADPDEAYNAGKYFRQATKVVEKLHREGKIPLVEGGTGLYIRVLTDGLFQGPAADYERRALLEKEADREGLEVLYHRLIKLDPEIARRIQPADRMRIIRALEVVEGSGKPLSAWQKETSRPSYSCIRIGLNTPSRAVLYQLIEQRVDRMIAHGLINEVRGLLGRGYSEDLNAMQGLGYKQIALFLKKGLSLDEAVNLIKRDTRRFAKRQLTWFGKDDRIHWFSTTDLFEQILKYVKEMIQWKDHGLIQTPDSG